MNLDLSGKRDLAPARVAEANTSAKAHVCCE